MQFNAKDFVEYYKVGATAYSVEIYVTPLSVDDYKTIVEKFKYYGKRDGVSWQAIYSTTDSDTAKQTVNKTGRVGRPRKIVNGQKIDGHTHNIILGNANKSAHGTAQAIKKSIDKSYARKGKKTKVCKVVSISDGEHFYNKVGYDLRQADIIRTGGDFDFEEYYNTHDRYG